MTVVGPCLLVEGVNCSRGPMCDHGMGEEGGCCTDGHGHGCAMQKLLLDSQRWPILIGSGNQSGTK